MLLGALHDAGEDRAVATLAARAAGQAPLGDSGGVAVLLGALHDAGEDQAVATLAARAHGQAPLDNYLGVAGLLGALHHAGEDQAVATLTARAADAGLWEESLKADPRKARQYTFGREPDGTASAPWGWRDLIDHDRKARGGSPQWP